MSESEPRSIREFGGEASYPLRAAPLGPFGPWSSRIRSIVLGSQEPLLVRVDEDEVVDAVIESIESIETPTVGLDCRNQEASMEALGTQLVDSINRATRAQLLQYGQDVLGVLDAFDRLVDVLGPFLIVVRGAGSARPEVLDRVARLARSGNRVVYFEKPSARVDCAGCSELKRGLSLTLEEALWLADGRLSPSAVEELHRRTSGSIGEYASALAEIIGTNSQVATSTSALLASAVQDFGLQPRTVLAAILKRRRFVDALQYATEQLPEAVPEIIEDCGEQYFARGQFERFWILLSRLPEKLFEDERVLRWLYAAAMALNRHGEVVPRVEAFLAANDAPELRAQYAASRPRKGFLQETSRAVMMLESPVTLRHHAFALALDGRHKESIDVLHRGLRLAELLGKDQLVVAIATDLCGALQRAGEFEDSLSWGEWAVAEYLNRGLNEHYRRMCALAATAFSKILVGDDVGLTGIAQELQISEGLLGVPSYEGIASTVADVLFVRGQLDRALELYESIFKASPLDQAGSAAVDLVKCLVEVGRTSDAMAVARRVVALSQGASEYQRKCAALAHGIACRAAGVSDAVEMLRGSSRAFGEGFDTIKELQARINLLLALAATEANYDARAEFGSAAQAASQLGESGWVLLGGHDPRVLEFRNRMVTSGRGLHVSLLGQPLVILDARRVDLSDRRLELLVLLLTFRSGLTLLEVAAHIYGDRGVVGTTKALVSRLRETIPVESRPYRLGVSFRADFLELLEHLKRGRVRQALNLYKGPLLPESEAPAIVELREHIDESLRQAVLASGDAEAMIELVNRTDAGDLELLETALEHLPPNDPQSPLLRARIRQVRRDWESGERGASDPPRSDRKRRSDER